MERAGRHIGGFDFEFENKVFLAELGNATNVAGIEAISSISELTIVRKTEVLDLSDHLEEGKLNLEGMCLGPKIKGRQTLYFVSDNNFHESHSNKMAVSPSRFLLFFIPP